MLDLADGTRHVARRVLLATGMDYRYPDVPGHRRALGCVGVPLPVLPRLGGPRPAARRARPGRRRRAPALLLRAWSDDVTLLTNGPPS